MSNAYIQERQWLWALIGILIGFYGNWYFNLLVKLEKTLDGTIELIWIVSALTLFLYCVEVIHPIKKIIFGFRLSFLLAIAHLISIFAIYMIAKLSTLYFSGITLWAVIIIYEGRMHRASKIGS